MLGHSKQTNIGIFSNLPGMKPYVRITFIVSYCLVVLLVLVLYVVYWLEVRRAKKKEVEEEARLIERIAQTNSLSKTSNRLQSINQTIISNDSNESQQATFFVAHSEAVQHPLLEKVRMFSPTNTTR